MEYTNTQLTEPASEPVTLALAKRHLAIDHADDDALLTLDIGAARELCEAATGRIFGARTFRLTIYQWPEDGWIRIPVEPLVSVQAVKYVDEDGVIQTVSASDYALWLDYSPPTISLKTAFTYPSTDPDTPGAITVEYTAGGAAPKMLQKAILLILEDWQENPDGNNESSDGTRGIPDAAAAILGNLWTGAL